MDPLEKAKFRGLRAYASSNYEDAIDHFTTAINLDKTNFVLYSNRSVCAYIHTHTDCALLEQVSFAWLCVYMSVYVHVCT